MIETARLLLRPPEPRDDAALVALLGDPQTMRDINSAASPDTARASIERHRQYRETRGLGFWVAECEGAIAGFCGLKPGAPGTPIEGEVEIGWIFAPAYWGRGFGGEAARASLAWGWANLDAPRIVAITALCNLRSQKLMQRLGMAAVPHGVFEHPAFAPGDPLRATITFAIARPR